MKFCHRVLGFILFNFTILVTTALAGPGTFDPSFVPTLNGAVFAMGTQPDGRVIIGGNFTSVNSTNRARIARIFPDGTLDTSFQNGLAGVSGTVNALVVQPDGKILIAGEFSTVNSVNRNHVARLNPDGSLDTGFVPSFNLTSFSIYAVAVQSDNKVIIGGNFSNSSGGTNRNYIARLNADGTFDAGFNPSSSANGIVYSVAVQPDGKILMGGAFSTVFGIPRGRLARLLPDGVLDLNFMNGQNGPGGNVRSILVQNDGKILIGGDFTSVNTSTRNRVARLNSDGTTDTNSFSNTGPSSSVYALAVQNDGDIIMAGDFTSYLTPSGSFTRSRVARSFSDGTFDGSFMTNSTGANLLVRSVALQSDGKVLIGGDFTTLNGTNRAFIARLYGDLYPPEIVTQPASRNTGVGSNITFSVNVNNPTPVNYQWRRDGVNIPGATLNAYTLFNVETNDSGIYSVYVSSGAGALTSSNAVLNVGIEPTILSQPTNITVLAGQNANFTVGASGWPLNYQWRKNGAVIPGATNASLNFTNVVITNVSSYSVTITNFLGTNVSTTVSLTILVPAAITLQPTNQTVGEGSNTTFSVTAIGTGPLIYQWLKDGGEIPGATASNYSITNAQFGQEGEYKVIVTNSYAAVTSQVATLTVLRYAPAIVTQPQSRNIGIGSNVTFSVAASGTTLSYQWLKDDLEISGATDSSYALTNLTQEDAGAFTVVVTNFVGSVTSAVATLDVGYAPVLISSPVSQSNFVGTTIVFSGSVTGSLPMELQWLKDGEPLISETNSSITISNAQPGNMGSYQFTATNSFGDVISTNATLTLAPVPLLAVETSAGNFGFVSNQFGFNVTGPSGQTIVVEASTNLVQWDPVYTNTLETNGFYFLDSTPDEASQKYFRLRGP